MFSIEMLRANEGDALWVEYGDPAAPNRILIDCGYKSTYREILDRLDADAALAFELFVLTHIDADHIAGAVPFIADARVTPQRIGEVWFNSRKHLSDKLGVEQAEYFTHSLAKRKFRLERSVRREGHRRRRCRQPAATQARWRHAHHAAVARPRAIAGAARALDGGAR